MALPIFVVGVDSGVIFINPRFVCGRIYVLLSPVVPQPGLKGAVRGNPIIPNTLQLWHIFKSVGSSGAIVYGGATVDPSKPQAHLWNSR
jgi:hypothetical protein